MIVVLSAGGHCRGILIAEDRALFRQLPLVRAALDDMDRTNLKRPRVNWTINRGTLLGRFQVPHFYSTLTAREVDKEGACQPAYFKQTVRFRLNVIDEDVFLNQCSIVSTNERGLASSLSIGQHMEWLDYIVDSSTFFYVLSSVIADWKTTLANIDHEVSCGQILLGPTFDVRHHTVVGGAMGVVAPGRMYST